MSLNIFPTIAGQQWKSKKRMKWDVSVQTSAQNVRKTLVTQTYPKWEITVSYKGLTQSDADMIMGFYGQQKGPFLPFLWKDIEDYKATRQVIGLGIGEPKTYYLCRTVGNGIVIPVYDPIPESLHVFLDGVETSAAGIGDDGAIRVDAPEGAEISATFEYYWRVAFDSDYNEQTAVFYDLFENGNIKLVSAL